MKSDRRITHKIDTLITKVKGILLKNGSNNRLVYDFGCIWSVDMYNELLRERGYYFKDTAGRIV